MQLDSNSTADMHCKAEYAFFLLRDWELVLSDPELQFDLDILRARPIPADFNLRTTTPHHAWPREGSSPGKVKIMQT